jgi:hypothetical protein
MIPEELAAYSLAEASKRSNIFYTLLNPFGPTGK